MGNETISSTKVLSMPIFLKNISKKINLLRNTVILNIGNLLETNWFLNFFVLNPTIN